jgi:hypothetical protein
MDAHKASVEVRNILEDHGVLLPSNPYDANNLEDALYDFLDRFFESAYSDGGENRNEDTYDDGWQSGHDAAMEKIYSALDNM